MHQLAFEFFEIPFQEFEDDVKTIVCSSYDPNDVGGKSPIRTTIID